MGQRSVGGTTLRFIQELSRIWTGLKPQFGLNNLRKNKNDLTDCISKYKYCRVYSYTRAYGEIIAASNFP